MTETTGEGNLRLVPERGRLRSAWIGSRGIALWLVLGVVVLSSLAAAQDDRAMPEITERLWRDPGPVQSEPGAPRVLLLYPGKRTRLSFQQKSTRYAGRVDPPEAEVRIDGEPVRVWPGGVFTGLVSVPVGERELTFTASYRGRATTIRRRVAREERRLGPPSLPLAFHPTDPVLPGGREEFWLRAGSKLALTLYASGGHEASARVGDRGPWLPMEEIRATPEQGGAYRGEITADRTLSESELKPIQFRLRSRGSLGAEGQSIEMTSRLRVKRLAEDLRLAGTVKSNLATFLKNPDPSNWDRWGNWSRGAPFPVIEKLGPRFKVDFGRGERGFVEVVSVLNPEPARAPQPTLDRPKVDFTAGRSGERLTLDWKLSHPIAAVFTPHGAEGGRELEVSLIGAADAREAFFGAPPGSAFVSVRVIAGSGPSAPRVRVVLRERELWGYGFSMLDPETLRLTVRARPDPPRAGPGKPLGGLRIMVDAGHGGSDRGALGPSGLAEADVNWVVSAYLGARLERLGAEVRQVRVGDEFVELDARVDMALDWDPDLFISVHHNSVPMGTHPMKDRGSKTFYHYPHAVGLAREVDEALTPLLTPGEPASVVYNVFRVNRNLSICPSILVEGGFVCNPLDEIHLRQTATLERMAHAIAEGVVRLFR